MSRQQQGAGVPEELGCRRWLDATNNNCGKPARYIVWGKLNPQEALGPRCVDCLLDQQPNLRLYQIDQYAIYELPDLPALQEHWKRGVRERLLSDEIQEVAAKRAATADMFNGADHRKTVRESFEAALDAVLSAPEVEAWECCNCAKTAPAGSIYWSEPELPEEGHMCPDCAEWTETERAAICLRWNGFDAMAGFLIHAAKGKPDGSEGREGEAVEEAAQRLLDLVRSQFPKPPSLEWAQAGNALDYALCASRQPDSKDHQGPESEEGSMNSLTPNQRKELEDVVVGMVERREQTEPRDRLTPRMHAADLLKAVRVYLRRQKEIDREFTHCPECGASNGTTPGCDACAEYRSDATSEHQVAEQETGPAATPQPSDSEEGR